MACEFSSEGLMGIAGQIERDVVSGETREE